MLKVQPRNKLFLCENHLQKLISTSIIIVKIIGMSGINQVIARKNKLGASRKIGRNKFREVTSFSRVYAS